MCDYSAETVNTRKAAVGEKIVTDYISSHGTVGFVSEHDTQGDPTAICLLPGTKLIVSGIPEKAQQAWGVGAVATATFDQRTVDGAKLGTYYRDGVIFDGKDEHVSLQDFENGIVASVEMLPDVPDEDAGAHAERVLENA